MANRRHFDQFLSSEGRRHQNDDACITALADIDHFKRFDDEYEHIAGDYCLKQIAAIIKLFGKRPSDLCARYGGEEFAIVLGNTDSDAARNLGMRLLQAIQNSSFNHSAITASLGLAAMHPQKGSIEDHLIEAADKALYAAKNLGRNQLCISDYDECSASGVKGVELSAQANRWP